MKSAENNLSPYSGRIVLVMAVLLGWMWLGSCNSEFTPKPRGYYKIDFPKHEYRVFDSAGFPYSFEYPVYARIVRDTSVFDGTQDNPYWVNVDFPQFNGRFYLSYKTIGGSTIYKVPKEGGGYRDSVALNTFDNLREDAYKMTFKHTYKATSIEDSAFQNPQGIPGVYFFVGGNAATQQQFYVTDTSRRFLRGAIYFDAAPNEDSLRVVNDFLSEDLRHLINTLRWKN